MSRKDDVYKEAVKELHEKANRYESALHAIYNIDAMFLTGDTERDYDVEEAHDEMLRVAREALYGKR